MWFVISALRHPISILVIIIGILFCSSIAIRKMPIDIFPVLGMPVVYVAQPYGGLDPSQMEGFVSSYYEYHFLYITGIKEVESRSIQGVSLIKLVFHPGTDMSQAVSEVVAYVNRARAFMPPGTVPPFIVRFDAGSVPVGNLVFSSKTRSLGEIQDLALFKVRPMFAALPGVSAPPPMGGNQRTVVIHIDPERLRQYEISPDQVVTALSSGNVITPAGNVRVGDQNLIVINNGVVDDIKILEDIPIRPNQGPSIFLRDIGWAENSMDILSSYALVDGKRAVFIPVTKRADASTWSVVQEIKKALPSMRNAIPSDINLDYEFDQSGYVKNAIVGLLFEASLGAVLTGLVVLVFLQDFRSALIVIITIPLSILFAVFGLFITGQTINIMTLGGLALSVGILVDETTVTVENIHTQITKEKSLVTAVIDSSREITGPRFLILACILSVFVPCFFMTGISGALFIPLALAVGFSMIASYFISQTLVPILSIWFLPSSKFKESIQKPSKFDEFKEKYKNFLRRLSPYSVAILSLYLIACFVFLLILINMINVELFPTVDTGQFKVRIRAPVGTRVEKTEEITLKILDIINQKVGANNVETSLAFVGTQPSSYPINTIYLWTSGPHEAVLSVAMKKNLGISIPALKEYLREEITKQLPDVKISFEYGDLVSQVTSLGAQTPVEIAIIGKSLDESKAYAEKLKARLKKIPNLRDLQIGEALDYPSIDVNIDRIHAGQLGVTIEQIGNALVSATSSSRFTQPNYWLDKTTGTAYQVQVEVPQSNMRSIEDLKSIPVTPNATGVFVGDVARISNTLSIGEYHRLNSQRMISLTANIIGTDLRKTASEIQNAINETGTPPVGMNIQIRSQISLMYDTFSELGFGLIIATIAIFLLLAAYFQSFKLALVSLTPIPAVLIGVALILIFTGTSLNIQSYLGSIMAIGVSIANAILFITFAEGLRRQTGSSKEAAIDGGAKRIRPIAMTAIAMIAGMIPMSLVFTEGGDQIAPLARAVIGGLFASTIATLIILPLAFSIVQEKSSTNPASLIPDDYDHNL